MSFFENNFKNKHHFHTEVFEHLLQLFTDPDIKLLSNNH